ncbi:hypothetical protein BS78_01G185600 [Paspalum vaginatum]|nr:hypothetical protein BS78_01G185600 [Paspalum vaginatum]
MESAACKVLERMHVCNILILRLNKSTHGIVLSYIVSSFILQLCSFVVFRLIIIAGVTMMVQFMKQFFGSAKLCHFMTATMEISKDGSSRQTRRAAPQPHGVFPLPSGQSGTCSISHKHEVK